MTISGISSSMTMPVPSMHGGQEQQTGAVGGKRPPPPQGGPGGPGGALPAAVSQTLSKLGLLDTEDSSTGSSAGTQNDSAKVQAIGSFMLDLMGALHAQHEQNGATQSSGFGTEGKAQLSTDGTASDGDDSSVLERSFESLLSALGASDSEVTLTDFLDALSTTGLGSSGNVVDTQA